MNTSNIGLASYICLQGKKIANYSVGKRGIVTFTFELTEEEFKKMKLDYNNSEFLKFKQLLESIRAMIENKDAE